MVAARAQIGPQQESPDLCVAARGLHPRHQHKASRSNLANRAINTSTCHSSQSGSAAVSSRRDSSHAPASNVCISPRKLSTRGHSILQSQVNRGAVVVDNQKVLDHNLSQEPEIGSSDLHEQRPSAVLATGGLRVEKGIEQELGHGRVGDDRGSRSREYRLEERSRTESIDIIPRLTDHHDNATLRELELVKTFSAHVPDGCKASTERRSLKVLLSGLEVVAGDVLTKICGFIQPRDIARLSTVSPCMFNDRIWHHLHLALYGRPRSGLPRSLPLAHASRIQLESDFPMHHARLIAIRHHHWLIRSPPPVGECSSPRRVFVLETLRREDTLLRAEETAVRLRRAESRRKHHSGRTSALRDLVLAKRASTEERMVMVDMKAAVERHAYAPGGRPKALPTSSSRETRAGGRGVLGGMRSPGQSLEGVFCDR